MIKEKLSSLKQLKMVPVVLGSVVSMVVALALILVFALIIRYAGVPNGAILPVNIFIKILSIGVGVFVATKNGQKGLVKGISVGLLFIVLSFFVFAILTRSIALSWSVLADLGLGAVVGAICGVVFVNLRK